MSILVDISKIDLSVGMIVSSDKETIFGDKIYGIISNVSKTEVTIDWHGDCCTYYRNSLESGDYNFKIIISTRVYDDQINESEEEND